MPNKIAKHKKSYTFILEKELINSVDKECSDTGLNRTETIRKSIKEHLKLEPVNVQEKKIKRLESRIETLEDTNFKLLETTVHQAADIIKYQEENKRCVSEIATLMNKIAYLENRGLWARIVNKKQNKKLLE